MPANLTDQNRITDSATPSSANWTAINLTGRTANFGANPFGSANDSCLLEESAAVGGHRITNSATLQTFASTGWYCVSCWFKPGTRNFGGLLCDFGAVQFGALWNLTTFANTFVGVVVGGSPAYSTTNLIVSDRPTPSVAGWRQFSLAFEVLQAGPPAVFPSVDMSSNGALFTYLGVVGQTVEIWNPQLVKSNWAGQVTVSNPAAVNAAGALRLLENR